MLQKQKIIIGIAVVSFILLMIFFALVSTEDADIVINEFSADIIVGEDGSMLVTETWDMHYEGDYNVRFRDFDYVKYPDEYPLYKNDSNQASFVNNAASVIVLKNGKDVTSRITTGYSFNQDVDELGLLVSCEPVRTECESIFTDFSESGGLDGYIRFIYQYKIDGAVTEYSDISELNWTLFEYAESKVEKGSITITLPDNENSIDSFRIFSHQIEDTTSVLVANNKIVIDFEDMREKDVLAFRLLMPTTIFPDIGGSNKVIHPDINKSIINDFEVEAASNFETGLIIEETFKYVPFIVALFMLLITYLLHITLFGTKRVVVNDAYYSAPSKHSPAQVSFLMHKKKFKDTVITATLLDLVRRGYLVINDSNFETDKEDVVFIKNEKMEDNNLTSHERFLITWLFSMNEESNEVSTNDIKEYASVATNPIRYITKYKNFIHEVHQEGVRGDFMDHSATKKMWGASILNLIPLSVFIFAIIAGTTFNIDMTVSYLVSPITILLYSLFVWTRIMYSKFGQETMEKWEKYKNYLESEKNYSGAKLTDIEYWDEALVYATIFGIANKVMQQLTIHESTLQTQNNKRLSVPMSRYYRRNNYGMFHHIHSTFQSSYAVSSRNQAALRATSSGRSSGGFSGGSFGGGGGGGRSR